MGGVLSYCNNITLERSTRFVCFFFLNQTCIKYIEFLS